MGRAVTLATIAVLLPTACSIQQGALGGGQGVDGGGPPDASGADARPPADGGPDAGRRDAGGTDAGPDGVDAGPPADGGCADAPDLGAPCDGPDEDVCEEGRWECTGAGLVCSDDTGLTIEVCNDADDDCDGEIDEDAIDPGVWYVDSDGDGYGVTGSTVMACDRPPGHAGMGGDCNDDAPAVNPGETEVCNTVDDDCSGGIDDGGVCGCDVITRGGHLYLFCTSNADWTGARDYCAARGYALVTIDDGGENTWVTDAMLAREDDRFWIGLNDRGDEGSFTWVSGSGASYRNWASGQPNDYFGQDCAAIERGSDRGLWGDTACEESHPFVCEAAP